MKKTTEVTRCEFCDAQITLESPPCEARYNQAEIYISNGSILLPKEVVKKNHKKRITDSHVAYIDGRYCGYKCFIGQIEKILHMQKRQMHRKELPRLEGAEKVNIKISILFWRILKKSKVFNYWYKKHLTELLYDLEIYDLEKEEIIKKYKGRFDAQ